MKHNSAHLGSHKHISSVFRRRAAVGGATGVVILAAAILLQQVPAFAATTVNLGTATSYSVLAGTTVTNTGLTTLQRDLGVSPGTAITGFPPGNSAGVTHAADAVALQAQSDVTIAYNNAAGQPLTTSVSGDLVGRTLTEGVYGSTSSLALSGPLTLDGQGNPNSVFVFQAASTLITASASSIILTNSAQACNVFWQVGSSATLGTASSFKGTILALTSITVETGATVEGRALARNGQVSLDTNVFISPSCATTPSTSAPATGTPTTTTQSPSPTAIDTTTPRANETESTPSESAVPLAGTGGLGRNKGTNVDTAVSPSNGGPAVFGAIAAALAVTTAIVFAVRPVAGRRRSSQE
ncbi:ice-binding family protein [Pseudarthrobacter sp. RMG13]|uniref:Ice-binding family protein n=1 Tax=Pseudarthrobacter humi TaxID=2952523 RepID=A0ABT1LU17_9MICC|nr:ice-binding family protein [Pseudarthrobacter humi]MCP9001968.1 ice-binding family protein [Pseudarthrobacter humi]